MGTKKKKSESRSKPAGKNPTRTRAPVARAHATSTSKPREVTPQSAAQIAYKERNGLTPEGIQIAHSDGTPTQAFMDAEDERAAREAQINADLQPTDEQYERAAQRAGARAANGWLGRPIGNGIHPVHDDLDRAEIIKNAVDPQRLREALLDADARLREFTKLCDSALVAFNEGAETEAQKIKSYEDIPVWVKDMMGLLVAANANADAVDGDAGVDPALVKALEERDAAVVEAQRWEKEREAALQSARVHREAADAAVKELRVAQREQDAAVTAFSQMRADLAERTADTDTLLVANAKLREAEKDHDAALTVARAFELMVADERAVLDLSTCSEETTRAVAAAMAVIEPEA